MRTQLMIGILLLAACGGSGGGDDDVPRLEVSPGDATIDVIDGVPATQAFTAILVDGDGDREDVTSRASFAIEPQYGGFSGAMLTASGRAAGRTNVTASFEELSGSAEVTIFVRDHRVDPSAPPGAADLFEGATVDPARAPGLIYPPDLAIVPVNLGDLEVHFNAAGSDVFEVALLSAYAEVSVYVGGAVGGIVPFTPDEWAVISSDATTLEVRVRGANSASPGTIGEATRSLQLSNEPIEGGIYYFAAQSLIGELGIYRHDVSAPQTPPEAYFTASDSPNGCVGCHTLSRDGTRMAVTYGGNGPAALVDVATATQLSSPGAWNFASYAPEGDVLVTVTSGAMSLRAATDGAVLGAVSTSGLATHVEFSPDGRAIAYTQAGSLLYDFEISDGDVVTQSYEPGIRTFGPPTPLVTGASNDYYPSWSPDGQWLLFSRAAGGSSYDNPSASLWVVKADGSAPPVALSVADLGANLTNSWARWAPFPQTVGDAAEPMFWITFSSKRDFGLRLVGAQRPQIWMSAFFPGRAAAGMDPTAPAVRLPFQALESNNHIAQWTEEVVTDVE